MKFSLEKKSENSGIFPQLPANLIGEWRSCLQLNYFRLLIKRVVHPFVSPLEFYLQTSWISNFVHKPLKKTQPLPVWGWEFFRVVFKGGGHLQPCGWGGGSLNLFKWHHYECLNNPISSNLASCTACCCSINSSLGLTGGKPDKITILVFRLVLQFSFLIFSVILILLFLLTSFWLCCYCRMLLYIFQSMELGMC